MASKRSSRAYSDESLSTENSLPYNPPSYRSRRNSRNSIKEEMSETIISLEKEKMRKGLTNDDVAVSDVFTSTPIHAPLKIVPMHPTFTSSPAIPAAPLEGRPLNFGVVIPGVYRSSYPKPPDYDYIRGLKLKTVITLVKKDELDEELRSFTVQNGIMHKRIYMQGTKKEAIPLSTMTSILEIMLDRQNHPVLLHCNQGKHRTGCVVGVARKLSGWSLPTVLDEYKSYAEPKIRDCDLDYITEFQTATLELSVGQPVTFSPVQVRTFLRTLLFSSFVMVIWLVSGSQMTVTQPVDAYS
ncbi:hypothetical protein VHEMI01894 [[Torrubiella] hemipterigena]|uniref:diphosphoinositol-polyphosphate diphosphatase n=1 Tax=[Torrubiella] hemipterigena TaxID=1531966 RepID=A0A0A1SN38_9HYPO|nr:hypothetical protein VHEMI01894 [[Torrubiella] hemipterigena]